MSEIERSRPRIAVVGGGINGAGVAWELARRDYDVVVYEKGTCGAQTSSATTKMIHGGLRYLETLQFGLVRESLRERAWLLRNAPSLVKPIEILLPVYEDSPRNRAMIRLGLILYDSLAGRANIERHRSLSVPELLERAPLVEKGRRVLLLGRAGRRLRPRPRGRRLRDTRWSGDPRGHEGRGDPPRRQRLDHSNGGG
jgi:glycerol-3-phosphate dehydrogenase